VFHLNSHWRLSLALPLVFALGGCGTTVYLDKFNQGALAQPPPQPEIGTSASTQNVFVAPHPQQPGSADRWLKIARTVAKEGGGQYTATLSQSIVEQKGSFDFVAFMPSSSRVTLTAFFESSQGIPLLHIDLMPDGNIRLDDLKIIGTYARDKPVAFLVNFNLQTGTPRATIHIRGGAKDANVTHRLDSQARTRGVGRVRIFAPFEGINAPNGDFLVNDIIATIQ